MAGIYVWLNCGSQIINHFTVISIKKLPEVKLIIGRINSDIHHRFIAFWIGHIIISRKPQHISSTYVPVGPGLPEQIKTFYIRITALDHELTGILLHNVCNVMDGCTP